MADRPLENFFRRASSFLRDEARIDVRIYPVSYKNEVVDESARLEDTETIQHRPFVRPEAAYDR